MKFYVIEDQSLSPVDCFVSLKDAKKSLINEWGNDYSITMIECAVNADTVARLLGNMGGYAIRIKRDFV
jgi:hypothetical protein